MATQVQNRRGTTAEHSTFTGAVGEVTIDTDKDTAVVHDGSTAGGRPLLREDLSNLPAGAIDNADINASAAIAGTKISPNFGSQNVTTTGTATAASFIPTSSTVPTNGVYLPAANSVALSTNGTGRLFVDASGNVGVGANPSQRFSVFSGSAAGINNVAIFKGGGSSSGNGAGIILSPDSANTYATWYGSRIATSFGGASWGCDLVFSTNNNTADSNLTERLRITSAGLVGVGTSSPDASFRATIAGSRSAVAPGIFFSDTDASPNNYTLYINGSKNFVLRDQTNTADRLTVTPGGLVGIGTSAPSNLLEVSSANNSYIRSTATGNSVSAIFGAYASAVDVGSTTNHPLNFYTAGVNRATLDTSGRLGIGTSSPSALLDVTGSNGRMLIANGTFADSMRFSVQNATGTGNAVMVFESHSKEYGRFDTSGRLLVGTSSAPTVGVPSSATFVVQGYAGVPTGDSLISLQRGQAPASISSGAQLGAISFGANDGSPYAQIHAATDGAGGTNDYPGRLVFSTCPDSGSSPVERMRINNAGNVMFGCVTANNNNTNSFAVNVQNGANFCNHINGTASGVSYLAFNYNAGEIGSITQNGTTAVSYNTTSDYRLKENVVSVTDGIARLQQLKPSRFNFIADPDKTVDGFIAHEVQSVVPEAITGEKDAVDDEGNPKYQGIDQSKLVPLLTAALQEAIGEIESLKARVAALEAA